MLRVDSVEELKQNASPDFVAKNAEKLGIVATVEQVYGNQLPKQNKYHVSKKEDRTYKGVVYDSKREMLYFINTLEPKLKARDLTFVLRQVAFDLGAGVRYVADFVAFKAHWDSGPPADRHHSWEITVYEVKMWRKATAKHPAGFYFTPDAKTKMKLFREQYKELKLEIVK
jgi:hypothetical protein